MSFQRIVRSALPVLLVGRLLGAPTPPVSAPVLLTGPEVAKLDWNTRALIAADIDGDKRTDLLIANNDHSTIDILFQKKPGEAPRPLPKSVSVNRWEPVVEDSRFQKISITTGVTMFDLVAADFNNDGRIDLAYTGDPHPLILRYQQADGDWTEQKFPDCPDPLKSVGALRAGDLNGDKRADLALLGQKEIAIYFQGSDGKLAAPQRYALADDNCYGLELADIDGDQRPDLVYLCGGDRDALRVRLQTPANDFGPEQAYETKPTRCTLQILKNADKKSGATFGFVQHPTGQFEEMVLAPHSPSASAPILRPRVFGLNPGGKSPAAYTMGDFNGDGRTDLAATDPDAAEVIVYLRQADGGFTSSQRYPILTDSRAIASADLDGDGRQELFFSSPKELTIAVSSFTKEGRVSYPKPLAIEGKPLAFDLRLVEPKKLQLASVKEEKGKRTLELWTLTPDKTELDQTLELTGLKTDPKDLRFLDANQDGRADLALFTPLDAMRLYVQDADGKFAELTAAQGLRKGLVDALTAARVTAADIEGEPAAEMIVSSIGYSRALRVDSKNELVVVDQFTAREPTSEITGTLVLPAAKPKDKPILALYDNKADRFELLRANDQGLYQVYDNQSAGKIDLLGTWVNLANPKQPEAFLFGRDRFWWLPLSRSDYTPRTEHTHTTDLPDVRYSDVVAGDLNRDGQAEMVCIDPDKNLIEVLGRSAGGGWESKMHFKIFEVDEHFRARRSQRPEPRETLIADVTGDNKNDLILLVHDRILIYPQE